MSSGAFQYFESLAEICKPNEPLAAYTYLKLGGPAEVLASPRSRDELVALFQICQQHQIPFRILGDGCNVLVRDEEIKGLVIRLSEPAFTTVKVNGKQVSAGAGASLSSLISQTARFSLTGLESLVGVPGTVGGALRRSSGPIANEISQFVKSVTEIDREGNILRHGKDDSGIPFRSNQFDENVIVEVELELESDATEHIVHRMRKSWILRKAEQPLSFQAACRPFKNPRGLNADALIEKAGLSGAKVGGAQVSEREPNYVVAHPGATARDVLRLIDLIRTQIQERFNVELELEISIW